MRLKTSLFILIILSLALFLGSIPFSETIAQTQNKNGSSASTMVAEEISDPQINSVAGGPGFVTVSAYKFVTINTDDPMGRSGYLIYNPRATTITYAAQVDIPNGATIKKIVTYYYDTVSTNNLRVWIKRASLENGAEIELGSTLSWADTGFGWEYVNITQNNIVDLQNYYYFLTVSIPGGQLNKLGLVSVRVDYEYPGYIPCVTE